MVGVYILLGLMLVTFIWAVSIYNSLVRLRQHLKDSWSGIETELRRRYDLIPNLIETVKGYAAFNFKRSEYFEIEKIAAAPVHLD